MFQRSEVKHTNLSWNHVDGIAGQVKHNHMFKSADEIRNALQSCSVDLPFLNLSEMY